MMWQRQQGLWTLGAELDLPAPWLQVLEARGAILTWPLDAPADQPPVITVTDPDEADWLWQLIGEPGQVGLLLATSGQDAGQVDIDWQPEVLTALRKAAHGLWLRTWWPTSPQDGIAGLARDEVDRELAEVLAEVEGIVDDEVLPELVTAPVTTRADYALAASGQQTPRPEQVIASGAAPVAWQGVPSGVLDATEHPVLWSVDARPEVVVHVSVRMLGGGASLVAGLPVLVQLPPAELVAGALDELGTARIELPITAAEAWSADWTGLRVVVGAEVAEDPELRARVREFARHRRTVTDAISYAAEADDDY
ncbi:hypothetical protein [Enemella sp. A6]|uniref:hypothetical protein n=1 Tax=Enemella sp. A6 TaxID=3440152 RepID=UPI003EB747D7